MDLPNRILEQQPLRGETAYVYGLKARAQRHHCLAYGTCSVELDNLESLRKEYSRRIGPVTYLALYIKAVALALERHPEANAVLFKSLFGLRIVRFDKVDVNFPITRKVGERIITFIGTVRDAPAKSVLAIQKEITAYQRCPAEESFAIQRLLRFDRMPLWLARLVHWRMTRNPSFYIRNVGTCGLTILESTDWGEYVFPVAPTSVVFGIGAARREPVVRGDNIEIARLLKCVLMIDNFVVPGLVGGRLLQDFRELLESGLFIRKELDNTTSVEKGTGTINRNGPKGAAH